MPLLFQVCICDKVLCIDDKFLCQLLLGLKVARLLMGA
jgi:hypothetical protein